MADKKKKNLNELSYAELAAVQILRGAGASRFSGAHEWRAALANPRGADPRPR